ncbi:MAG TPA: aminotransferase class I/II-fold pyridoxal phosphate-dependent enzyme [Clostridia bacterium]|nr:aminotransferase class I/II-fold pyridoxal phosphate-dependent enzyme [Clostridia bacterium]
MRLAEYPREELELFYRNALRDYEACKAKGLRLDMSRGKPAKAQLDLSNELLRLPDGADCVVDGIDARNYGAVDGLPSCKRLFAEILGVSPAQVFAAGNASLNLMYDVVAKAHTHGLLRSDKPWGRLGRVKFLCPVPGYDRHFTVCETFGMEMISVPMTDEGPDMDVVESFAADPEVKGIWCVPKYSNPSGIVYSDRVIARLAALKPAAPDFIIMWDNAYCIHEFEGEYVPFPDILALCAAAGNPDMVFEFASTSKMTFPGAGVACFACSEANMAYMKKLMAAQVISYDKLNQLRHVLFLRDKANTLAHMKKHAALMKPKFDIVAEALERALGGLGIARWHKPKGGYFISLDVTDGCAKRVHALMKGAGVVMTGAGATFPYGLDPNDRNLRIAPSFPPETELKEAAEALCVCVRLAAAEKLLSA